MAVGFIEECRKFADLYRARFLEPGRRACPNLETDPWDSLKFFLTGYAFERQGRAQDYLPIAGDVVDECRALPLSKGSAQQIWRAFCGRLGNVGANHALNPLCPSRQKYQRRYKGEIRNSVTRQPSAVELVANELGGECIVAWAKGLIAEEQVRKAFDTLLRINGVSGKIASFFLRDVAVMHDLAPTQDRHLLQPVDIWIRLVARELSGDGKLDDHGCAVYIVNDTCQPETVNQGIWYFCAHVCGSSQYEVNKSLASLEYMQKLVTMHLKQLVEASEASRGFIARWGIEL